ncbi:3-isopropylmalate dehydratase small subunit 1-like [Elaeis guineensis]|uniref:3-isopropylmalate dehydratase small subunit 1-like n=1 Tax=Elaeis guineensis var. tenera TaxID=51953 RepID=UPI003C6D0517
MPLGPSVYPDEEIEGVTQSADTPTAQQTIPEGIEEHSVTISMAAAAAAGIPAVAARTSKTSIYSQETRSPLSSTFNLRFPSRPSFPKCPSFSRSPPEPLLSTAPRAAVTPSSPSPTTFHGPCYVIGDNIDTDQIIPAEHLTLVPSKPDEYQKLGSLALCGLPSSAYPIPFVLSGAASTPFPIVIAGANFGCGSSREHAPVALGAAGVWAVVAEYYARIFFRNSVSTGEMFPLESEKTVIWKECTTGDIVTVDLDERWLTNHTTGKEYRLKPIGDAGPVIEAGGIFAYARKTGMIASASTA